MGIKAPAEVKFALIYEAVKHDDNMLSISYMCEIAGVSRSGYYAWVNAAPAVQLLTECAAATIIIGYKFAL